MTCMHGINHNFSMAGRQKQGMPGEEKQDTPSEEKQDTPDEEKQGVQDALFTSNVTTNTSTSEELKTGRTLAIVQIAFYGLIAFFIN